MFSSLPHLVGFTQTFDANPCVASHRIVVACSCNDALRFCLTVGVATARSRPTCSSNPLHQGTGREDVGVRRNNNIYLCIHHTATSQPLNPHHLPLTHHSQKCLYTCSCAHTRQYASMDHHGVIRDALYAWSPSALSITRLSSAVMFTTCAARTMPNAMSTSLSVPQFQAKCVGFRCVAAHTHAVLFPALHNTHTNIPPLHPAACCREHP